MTTQPPRPGERGNEGVQAWLNAYHARRETATIAARKDGTWGPVPNELDEAARLLREQAAAIARLEGEVERLKGNCK